MIADDTIYIVVPKRCDYIDITVNLMDDQPDDNMNWKPLRTKIITEESADESSLNQTALGLGDPKR